MADNLKIRSRIYLLALFVIACGFILGVRDALFRELWFDEALTIGDFMFLPSVAAIYHNYVIPNNHIIYTMFLKLWNEFYVSGFAVDFYWRLFSVLTAALTVGVMFERWRKRYGTITLTLVLFAFCYSLPFEIYSTAIRGYMLSMLWIVLSVEFARGWVFKGGWRAGAGYFIFSLLAVGTIPSNLLALGGIVIFFFPYFGFKKVFKWKFIYLAAAPLAATALFYLPISRQVAGILKLHEGWNSGFAVVRVVYSSFLVAFFPLAVAAAAGSAVYFYRAKNRKFLWSLLVFLIPLAIVFIRDPAPFPRVFITLWPVWILLLCAGLRHFTAICRKRKNHLVIAVFLLAAVTGWGIASHNYKGMLARVCHGEAHLDDYFSPYYMAPEHKPWSLIQRIKKLAGDNEISVFISFNAEPGVITLYSRMAGIKAVNWIFDKPYHKLSYLPQGAWIVCRKNEILGIKKRFGVKLEPLFQNAVYSVFKTAN